MRRIVLLIALSLSLAACANWMSGATGGASGKPSTVSGAIKSQDFLGYQPIAPLPAFKVRYYDKKGNYNNVPWASLDNDLKKSLLPIQSSYTYVTKDDSSGDISLLTNTASVAKGDYTVISDYILYRVESVPEAGVGLVGVGMRVRAKITTTETGLNLSGLFNLALEAKANHLSGVLQVDVIGIYSKDVVQIFPAMTTEISPTSIQQVMQALAAIKAKISEKDVEITPHLLAFQQTKKGSKSLILDDLAYAEGVKKGKRQLDQIDAIVSYLNGDKSKWRNLISRSTLNNKDKEEMNKVDIQHVRSSLTDAAATNGSEVLPKLYDAYRNIQGGGKQ